MDAHHPKMGTSYLFNFSFPDPVLDKTKRPTSPPLEKKELLCTIGKEIRDLKDYEVTNAAAKVKVEINGLQALTKEAVVEFEDGSEALITKLGKHCSYCLHLSHEEEFCPSKIRTVPNHQSERIPLRTPEPSPPRSFNQRRDRHGNFFGERPSVRYGEIPRDQSPPANKPQRQPLTGRDHQRNSEVSQTHQRTRFSPPQRDHFATPRGTRNDLSVHLPQYQPGGTIHRPQLNQIWREKYQGRAERSDEGSTSPMNLRRPLERNLDKEGFPAPPGFQSEDQILESLQEVTVQYTNVDDPIERAARFQRVLESEARGLMAETARAMYVAQINNPSPRQVQETVQQHSGENAPNNALPLEPKHAQTLQPTKKPRGRPPLNLAQKKKTQTTSEAGPS